MRGALRGLLKRFSKGFLKGFLIGPGMRERKRDFRVIESLHISVV